MDRNMLLFIVVTIIVIGLYYFVIVPKYFPQAVAPVEVQKVETGETKTAAEKNIVINPQKFSLEKNEEVTIAIVNNKYTMLLSSIGGYIQSFKIKYVKNEKETIVDELIIPGNENVPTLQSYFSTLDFLKANDIDFKVEKIENNKYRLTKIIVDKRLKRVLIVKEYTFTESGKIDIVINVKGLDQTIPEFNEQLVVFSYGKGLGPVEINNNKNNRFEVTNNYANKIVKVKFKKNKMNTIGDFDWIAVTNLYYAMIIKKENVNNCFVYGINSGKNDALLYFNIPKYESVDNMYKFSLVFSPRDKKMLGEYEPSYKKIGENGGMLSFLVTPLTFLLAFFYKIMNSGGVAIILLSVMVKIILFPLTKKSSVAMKQMSELNPQIKIVQEKYKDNPAKAQAEVQNLYKKAGVNPLAGCLPLLIQFPFLFAMYYTLVYNLHLRGAGFMWIKDLSMPDIILTINTTLPFIGNELRLLPIIMLASQLIQSKFQPKQPSATKEQEMQSKMFTYLFPIIFFFVLYNMSSGLVLYWTCLNIFSIIETILITKVFPGKQLKPV